MSFIIDKQTLDDLKIFGKIHGNSIYGLFNHTRTRGGSIILEEMFHYPLTDIGKINQRSTTIRYFMEKQTDFPFRNEWFDSIEHYLSNRDKRTRPDPEGNTLKRKLRGYIGADTEYEQLQQGILAGIGIINGVSDFLEKNGSESNDIPCRQELVELGKITGNPILSWALRERKNKKLTFDKVVEYDHLLRYEGYELLKKILYNIYQLDVFLTVAEVARKSGFIFGKALPAGENILKLEGIYHPLLPQAIANSIYADNNSNLIFLTGANMAGKSTFMKTFGIIIFLAHMGFPLPARKVEFSVQNGMYTTINLPDNLSMGYSHFYAEVLRVKKVAEQIHHSGNLIVIFDELFRGTNVKDAYDATVAISEAFAQKKNCIFMISTHIIEAGLELKKRCNNINYVYLPTVMEGNTPTYTYTLKPGITNDRHGMMIIHNEGILDILKPMKSKN